MPSVKKLMENVYYKVAVVKWDLAFCLSIDKLVNQIKKKHTEQNRLILAIQLLAWFLGNCIYANVYIYCVHVSVHISTLTHAHTCTQRIWHIFVHIRILSHTNTYAPELSFLCFSWIFTWIISSTMDLEHWWLWLTLLSFAWNYRISLARIYENQTPDLT